MLETSIVDIYVCLDKYIITISRVDIADPEWLGNRIYLDGAPARKIVTPGAVKTRRYIWKTCSLDHFGYARTGWVDCKQLAQGHVEQNAISLPGMETVLLSLILAMIPSAVTAT